MNISQVFIELWEGRKQFIAIESEIHLISKMRFLYMFFGEDQRRSFEFTMSAFFLQQNYAIKFLENSQVTKEVLTICEQLFTQIARIHF